MSSLKIHGAAAILFALGASAQAQQAISEPGYCAFFYPNANCQSKGPGNPYTDPNSQRGASASAMGQTVGVAVKRPKKPATRLQ